MFRIRRDTSESAMAISFAVPRLILIGDEGNRCKSPIVRGRFLDQEPSDSELAARLKSRVIND